MEKVELETGLDKILAIVRAGAKFAIEHSDSTRALRFELRGRGRGIVQYLADRESEASIGDAVDRQLDLMAKKWRAA